MTTLSRDVGGGAVIAPSRVTVTVEYPDGAMTFQVVVEGPLTGAEVDIREEPDRELFVWPDDRPVRSFARKYVELRLGPYERAEFTTT
ncbi:MAG TPA: hypothetical protein VIU37_13490 [Candidatus Limnocylindrales bacterium]